MPTRRHFLQTSVGLSLWSWCGNSTYLRGAMMNAEAATAAQLVAGKSDELFVHSSAPFVLETPLALLDRGPLTPKEALFVRNNANPAGMAAVAASNRTEWNIELTGLSGRTSTIDLTALRELETTEVEMVLQCSGNGRSMFSRSAKTEGTPWGRGGIGNVKFSGVRLATVLKKLEVEPAATLRYLAVEGFDAPASGKADFEHSVPLDDALDHGLLALTMNGESLPAVHGGPVRFVLPGYYGTVQMKWPSRLRFETDESANEHHAERYRTPHRLLHPGDKYPFRVDNSDPTWKQKIATLVTSHADGQQVPIGDTVLQGYAWNDGSAALTAVTYSTDRGASWRRAELELATSPFAWSRWRAQIAVKSGRNPIWVAATDALGRTQPLDGSIFWNPGGYEWNGVEQVTLVG
jgi:sulfite oxidase